MNLFLFITGIIIGLFLGFWNKRRTLAKTHMEYEKLLEKQQAASFRELVLNMMSVLERDGISLSCFFIQNNLKNVVIYGYGIVGKKLVEDLQYSGINVCAIIDRNKKKNSGSLNILTLDSRLPEFDVMVVTPDSLDEVKRWVRSKGISDKNIISIKDILLLVLGE